MSNMSLLALLESFTSDDLSDALYQAKLPTGGNKSERVKRLASAGLDASGILNLFVVGALRDACEAHSIPTTGKKKSDLVDALVRKLDSSSSIGSQLSGLVRELIRPGGVTSEKKGGTSTTGVASSTPAEMVAEATNLAPHNHREAILRYLIGMQTSAELSEWLRDLGSDSSGTASEKKQRVLERTTLRNAPTNDFASEMVRVLRSADVDWSSDLCRALGIPFDGAKTRLIRRLHRYVATREGQIHFFPPGRAPTVMELYPIIAWYPIYQTRSYEADHYDDFKETMIDFYGDRLVHSEHVVPHGNALKIDFHIGHPMDTVGGVGVEFKMPANNSDIQRALGQIDQYQLRYRDSLIVVIFPDLIEAKKLVPLQESLARKGVPHVVKRVWGQISS